MLGNNKEYYVKNGSLYTATEIDQQPRMWLETLNIVKEKQNSLKDFMSKFDKDSAIYLCGAGTSEFVGNTIEQAINYKGIYNTKSVATTDIVSNPYYYFKKGVRTLVVSFGRSGSSPESTGTVNLANQLCDDVYHLVVTCNKDGNLAKESKDKDNYFPIILPEETNDKSFAMTSSYSSMSLATMLAFDINNLSDYDELVNEMIIKGNLLLDNKFEVLTKLVDEYDFERIIYLGDGALKGVAEESALKILELSAGEVTVKHDSLLGFRHGPKSIINETALTIFYMSDHPYTRKFELDLIKEMVSEKKGNEFLVVTNKPLEEEITGVKYKIEFDQKLNKDEAQLALPYIMVGQIIGLKKSNKLGISSDDPCPSGEVNRVVKGVTLYAYKGE